MSCSKPTDAVLWLSDVAISQNELEAALPEAPHAFGARKAGAPVYAKYLLPNGDIWRDIAGFFDRHGVAIERLIASRAVAEATLDLAYMFADDSVTRSAQVPAEVAAKVGQRGVSVVISTYPIGEG